MSTDHEQAEHLAPIDTDAPLPLVTATLRYVPDAHRQQYVRQMDGSFRLAWLEEGDERNRLAHLERIAAGALRVFPSGTTLESLAAEETRRAVEQTEIAQYLADAEKVAREKQLAAIERKHVAAIAKADAERARIMRSTR